MKVLLIQIGNDLPNIALMRIASHHRALGDSIVFQRTKAPQPMLEPFDRVYASSIFAKFLPQMQTVQHIWPDAICGGTVFDRMEEGRYVADKTTVEQFGIVTKQQDYSLYPEFGRSIGFTQRGCRLNCYFCGVFQKEGPVRQENTIADIWRGDPYPRQLHLLDNDFFGQEHWRERIEEIRAGPFKVSFSQGINARFLTDEAAEAIASVEYRDDGFSHRRIYTAWDSIGDEVRLFEGLRRLTKYGVKPDNIMVYMLIGGKGDTPEGRAYRWKSLRDFGARPYPMPYVRTPELVGWQRWIIGAYDKRFTWEMFEANHYRPEGLVHAK